MTENAFLGPSREKKMTNGDHMGSDIDIGGTYSDAAMADIGDGIAMSKAKALTARRDLSIGIVNDIKGSGGSLH